MSADHIPSKPKGELLPCPFCGCAPSFSQATNARGWWLVSCFGDDCPALPRVEARSREKAIADWNKRAPAETSELQRLRHIENMALRVASGRRKGVVTDKTALDNLDAALEATKPPETGEQPVAWRLLDDKRHMPPQYFYSEQPWPAGVNAEPLYARHAQKAEAQTIICQCGHSVACHSEFSCRHYGCDCHGVTQRASVELSPNDAASFEKTLARSPRRIPSREADHCDYPDCEHHWTLVVDMALAAMKALHESAEPDENHPDIPAVIPAAAFRAFVDEHARLMRIRASGAVTVSEDAGR